MNSDVTLDELLGRFCGALEAERGSVWQAGDLVNYAVDDMRRRVAGTREFRRARAALYRQFASAGHCTTCYVGQRADASGAFGTEQRFPDVGPSYYRAVLQAAWRDTDDAGAPNWTPRDLLTVALAQAWSVADLNAMGRPATLAVALSETCTACGAKTRVTLEGSTATAHQGLVLTCPVCAAKARTDGGDMREAPQLGQLEAA